MPNLSLGGSKEGRVCTASKAHFCLTGKYNTTSQPSNISMEGINPSWSFVPIERGSFAIVSVLTGRLVAFKHCHRF
ncbi:hypothetical protein CPB84DRAFT_1773238 [Gymnopilus junonius]|uniref:Uncharacterized protein n=1 Tax=Gymnopilus junonius TaxID=109634 RepID=A0A9P5NPH0_GYMJU|nr:hypothetical protein CPB84DRAFT_1773238 [Gymnopilus junonius]